MTDAPEPTPRSRPAAWLLILAVAAGLALAGAGRGTPPAAVPADADEAAFERYRADFRDLTRPDWDRIVMRQCGPLTLRESRRLFGAFAMQSLSDMPGGAKFLGLSTALVPGGRADAQSFGDVPLTLVQARARAGELTADDARRVGALVDYVAFEAGPGAQVLLVTTADTVIPPGDGGVVARADHPERAVAISRCVARMRSRRDGDQWSFRLALGPSRPLGTVEPNPPPVAAPTPPVDVRRP